jgi:hypothetical protein
VTAGQWLGVVMMLTGLGMWVIPFVFDDLIDSLLVIIGGVIVSLALIIFGALMTFNDNPHHLHEGYVVGKKFTPAHTTWTTQCFSTGKTTVCHPQPIFVDDDWALKLRLCDEERRCENGTLHFDDSAKFDEFEVGDYYPKSVVR